MELSCFVPDPWLQKIFTPKGMQAENPYLAAPVVWVCRQVNWSQSSLLQLFCSVWRWLSPVDNNTR